MSHVARALCRASGKGRRNPSWALANMASSRRNSNFFGIYFKTKTFFFNCSVDAPTPAPRAGLGKTRRVHGAPLLRVRIQSCCSVVAAFRRFARVKKFDVCVWVYTPTVDADTTCTYPPPHMYDIHVSSSSYDMQWTRGFRLSARAGIESASSASRATSSSKTRLFGTTRRRRTARRVTSTRR